MGLDDTIQVRCTRCKSKFRDRARRVKDGYSRQCPACECMVFFIEGSPNKDVQEALRDAERVRKALREVEYEQAAARVAASAAKQSEDGEPIPITARRRMDRRSSPAGRTTRSGRS